MAMKIDLTREPEKIVEEELKTGQFRTPEEEVGEALQALRNQTKSSSTQRAANDAQRKAVSEMMAFVKNNHVRLEGISVKELIRDGHRL